MDTTIQARVHRVGQICKSLGIPQSQIAVALGASQSQVSRILGGRNLRASRLLEEVCLYVERFESGVTADAVRNNEDLVNALTCVWDGSSEHARALSTVIQSLATLRGPVTFDSVSERSRG